MKEVQFYKKKLDNGITVLFEKRKIPVVAVSTSVKFGAQYETEDIKGISHFLEHLVFKGTKKRTVKEIAQAVESKGGIINAFTSEEVTSYWNKLPGKHFSLGADITRDLVVNPIFEKEPLERERKVILEEIKMYHDNPSSHVFERIKEMLYEKPFNMSIAGTSKTVSGLSRQHIIDLHKSIYSTDNIIFSIVGDAKWEDVLDEAKKFPKTKNKINDIPIIRKNDELTEKRKGIDQAHLVFGFHCPTLSDKNRHAMELFDSILGGGMSSRLFQEVREKKGLCYAIKSNLEQSKDYAHEMIYSGTTKDKVKEIREIVLREIKKMNLLQKSDFNEGKERLLGLRQISKEKCDSTMVELLQEELGGDASRYYKFEEEVNKIKLKDVRNLSKIKGYSFVSLIPG